MSKGVLKYRKYQKKENSLDPNSEPMFYARAVPDRTVEFEDLVTHMSEHNSPYSRGVIHGVLTDMLDCVKELVLDGKNVRLGDLGLFSVGIRSKGSLTAKDWTIGYHYYITRDGKVHRGRPLYQVGAHAAGFNRYSIGICYEGGLLPDGTPADTRTPQQRNTLHRLLLRLKKDYPDALVKGHRDLPGVKKECPCFDVSQEYTF